MKPFCISSALLSLLAIQASGALFISDRFNYPDGPITELPGTQWASHGGTSRQVDVLEGAVILTQSESEDVNAAIPGGPFTNATLYASCTVTFSTPPRGAGGFFLHFKDSGSGQRARVYASTNQAPVGFLKLGIANGSGTPQFVGENLALGESHRVVVRYQNASPGLSTLWINPVAESDTQRRADSADGGNLIQVQGLALRQSLSSGDGMGVLALDDLLVGGTFGDVAGANTPPTISALPDIDMGVGGVTAVLPFIVQDQETASEALTVSVLSSDPGVVSTKGISFHGAGSERGIRLTASTSAQGTAVITLTVSDGSKASMTGFTVTVGAPSIDGPVAVDIPANSESDQLRYHIGDRESAAVSLAVSAESSNPKLLHPDGIAWSGSGDTRWLQLKPMPGMTGLSDVRIRVSDGVMSREWALRVNVFPVVGVLLTDGFDRPDGSLLVGASPWEIHAPADGNASNLVLRAGNLPLLGNHTEDVSVRWQGGAFTPESAAILNAGIGFRLTNTPSSQGGFWAHFRDDRNGFRARLHVASKAGSPGQYQLGIAAGSEAPLFLPSLLTLGEAYTVVVQYRVATGEARLWLNPMTESDTYLRSDADAPLIPISNWAFRQAEGIGGIEVDWIRVATGFQQVLDASTVPELRVVQLPNRVRLGWNREPRVKLQASWSLLPLDWFELAAEPQDDGDETFLELPIEGSQAYFRLIAR